MQKVLVTGATGFIGFQVVDQLALRGVATRVLVRRDDRSVLLQRFPAEIVRGDLDDSESLREAVRGVDGVIHLGARAAFEEYSLVRPSIVQGSLALMKAAREEGVASFVFASSLLVYAGHEQPIDGRTPLNPLCGYGRAKKEAEEGLARAADGTDMALATVRLPHVYGARSLMFRSVRRGRVMFPGSGKNTYAHLHVVDAARLLVACAESRWAGALPVADDQGISWQGFFKEVHRQYPHFSTHRVPRWLALSLMTGFTPIRRLVGRPSVYTPDAVRGWNLNQHVRPGLLWNELALRPQYPTIVEGISAVMEECVAFRWVHPMVDRRSNRS